MLRLLLKQAIQFSRENWWIYIFLWMALGVVIYTGKGDIIEIIFLFFLNILWNICFILMLDSNQKEDFSVWALFFALWNIFFVTLTLYWYIQNNEIQYLLWQASFVLWWIKNIGRYCFNKELYYINHYTLWLLALGVLIYIYQLNTYFYVFLQSLWFAGVTIGLVLKNDISRFFLMLLGTCFVVGGSSFGIVVNYINGELLWITLSYAILTLTTFLFYMRILPKYISRIKN